MRKASIEGSQSRPQVEQWSWAVGRPNWNLRISLFLNLKSDDEPRGGCMTWAICLRYFWGEKGEIQRNETAIKCERYLISFCQAFDFVIYFAADIFPGNIATYYMLREDVFLLFILLLSDAKNTISRHFGFLYEYHSSWCFNHHGQSTKSEYTKPCKDKHQNTWQFKPNVTIMLMMIFQLWLRTKMMMAILAMNVQRYHGRISIWTRQENEMRINFVFGLFLWS